MAFLGKVIGQLLLGVKLLLTVDAGVQVHLPTDVVDQLDLAVEVEFQAVADVLEKTQKHMRQSDVENVLPKNVFLFEKTSAQFTWKSKSWMLVMWMRSSLQSV